MCSDLPDSPDDWSDYSCIDLRSKIDSQIYQLLLQQQCVGSECTSYDFAIELLEFNPKDNFWIDEVFIASEEIHGTYIISSYVLSGY